MARTTAKKIEVYNVKDVMIMLDCSRTYAYGVIKKLRKELEDLGYINAVPSGKIQKSYFNKRVLGVETELKRA